MFSQRVSIRHIVNEVIVINGDEDNKEYSRIRRELKTITDLCDESENWIKSADKDYRDINLSRVVTLMDWFCRTLSVEK